MGWGCLSYLCGWVVRHLSQLLTVQLTPWQLMLFCNTNVSSPSYNLFLNSPSNLSTSQTATQAVRRFQPSHQRSNERPCSGWINTPFNHIIVFVRDKGQVLVGPSIEGHAMSCLNQCVFLLKLWVWALQRKYRGRTFSLWSGGKRLKSQQTDIRRLADAEVCVSILKSFTCWVQSLLTINVEQQQQHFGGSCSVKCHGGTSCDGMCIWNP